MFAPLQRLVGDRLTDVQSESMTRRVWGTGRRGQGFSVWLDYLRIIRSTAIEFARICSQIVSTDREARR
jgi:hypothetical protein